MKSVECVTDRPYIDDYHMILIAVPYLYDFKVLMVSPPAAPPPGNHKSFQL